MALVASPTLGGAVLGFIVLLLARILIGVIARTGRWRTVVAAPPLLLVGGGVPIDEHLRIARVRSDELATALRAAGVAGIGEVACAVLDPNGVISVTWFDEAHLLDRDLFSDVRHRSRPLPLLRFVRLTGPSLQKVVMQHRLLECTGAFPERDRSRWMAAGMGGLMWMPMLPLTLDRLLAIHLQPIPVLPAIAVLLGAAYLAAVVVLHRRGDRWAAARTAWWLGGVATLLVTTATGVDGYGMELFSVHMAQHTVLGMLTPILLVLGAPVALVLRVLPARSRARRLLLAALHSRPARVITHPLAVSALFLGSLYGLYFTPLFNALMATMWGHNLMLLHFIAVGWLYFWGILAVDPSPRPRKTGMRMSGPFLQVLELATTVPFHAFFGVAVMMSPTLLAPIFAPFTRMLGLAPLADQQTGGGIAWAFTEVPTLLVLGVLMIQWQRAEDRRLRPSAAGERREAAELAAYNAHLARIAGRA